jgi:hypothetical protein
MILYVTGHNHILAPKAASDFEYAEQDTQIAYKQTHVHPANKPYTYAHRLSQILKARLFLDAMFYQSDAESVNKFLNFVLIDQPEQYVAILALARPSKETSEQLNTSLRSYNRPDPIFIYYYELQSQFNPTWAMPHLIMPTTETIFKTYTDELTMSDAHMAWTKILLKRLTATE